jgi:hypothetical protein
MPAFHPSLPRRALPLANCSEMLWMAALECQHETVARGYSTTLHRGESPRWCERCAELVSFLRVFCLTMRRAGMPHRDPGSLSAGNQDRPLWSLGIGARCARHALGHNIESNNSLSQRLLKEKPFLFIGFSWRTLGIPAPYGAPLNLLILLMFWH